MTSFFSTNRNLVRVLLVLNISFLSFSCNKKESGSSEVTVKSPVEHAQKLCKKFIIADGHVDLPYRLTIEMFKFKKILEDVSQRTEKGNFDYVRAKEGGLDAPFMSIYVPSRYQKTGGAKAYADSLIDMMENLCEKHPDKFSIARSTKEVKENFQKGILSMPLGMENGAPIENEINNVKYFFDRGIRYITLTHSKDNQICDSSYDTTRTWNGLSAFGEHVLMEMNKVGIMVDVSHISDSAFYDVMRITKAPVIASHSSLRHFTPGFERNMNDDMLKVLAKNQGVIMINFGSTFIEHGLRKKSNDAKKHLAEYRKENGLTEKDSTYKAYSDAYWKKQNLYSTVEKVADHIDHVVKLVGVDYVGFGSDFDGVGDSLPEGLKDVSKYPNLIAELLKRGYSEEDIEKICYKNLFRVWDKVEQVAKTDHV